MTYGSPSFPSRQHSYERLWHTVTLLHRLIATRLSASLLISSNKHLQYLRSKAQHRYKGLCSEYKVAVQWTAVTLLNLLTQCAATLADDDAHARQSRIVPQRCLLSLRTVCTSTAAIDHSLLPATVHLKSAVRVPSILPGTAICTHQLLCPNIALSS
jgi:hypothetical protein